MITSKQFLCMGFFFSLITFTTTIVCKNWYNITEMNPIMNIMLTNIYTTILIYGLIWTLVFTLHKYFTKENMTDEACYLGYVGFFLFFFNLLHDTISIVGVVVNGV